MVMQACTTISNALGVLHGSAVLHFFCGYKKRQQAGQQQAQEPAMVSLTVLHCRNAVLVQQLAIPYGIIISHRVRITQQAWLMSAELL
jgi:hypothetical protein